VDSIHKNVRLLGIIMTLKYSGALKEKRKKATGLTSREEGALRLSNIGKLSKTASRFIDGGGQGSDGSLLAPSDDVKLGGIMGRARTKTVESTEQDDFLDSAFNTISKRNKQIKERAKELFNFDQESDDTKEFSPKEIKDRAKKLFNFNQQAKTKEGIEDYYSALAMSESSNDSTSRRTNKDGKEFGGFLNAGEERQIDHMNATGEEYDMDKFVSDPKLQKRFGLWHINDIDKEISKIKNIPVNLSDQNGLRAVAHLGGIGGMKEFIETNGEYNTKDELNTTLMSYYIKFSSGMEA